ncbi:MAG: gamma carbonic anhydrase family protein [Thermodesulfobacteriota bacterium]
MIKSFNGFYPDIKSSAFISENSTIIGRVEIGENSSVWFYSVIRGDVNYIKIGDNTNIQDNSVLHVTTDIHPLIIGDNVTVGHRAILHGCTIMNEVLIGMGSIVLDGAVVEQSSFIGAGSLVPPGFVVPRGKLVMGVPSRIKRDLTNEEIENIKNSALSYVKTSKLYKLDQGNSI